MAKIYFDNHSLDLARAKIFNLLTREEKIDLFDVVELSSGDYLPKSKMEDGRYKVYGGGGPTQSTHTTSNVDFETIGIGRVGARCGCVFKIEKKSWVTDNALFVSHFKEKYDLSFLIHYLNHINLNQFANQSAQPVISQRGIAKCTIPDIEFYKQQQIGEILNAIESGEDFEDIFNLKSVLEFERNLSLLNSELDQQQAYLQLLRQTILQEAVQGKLTKQDPTDEPATELLKRIKAKKEKLIKAGKLKKEKELSPITEDEIPFQLPEGWVWCRLGELSILITSGSRSWKNFYAQTGALFIRSQNIRPGVLNLKDKAYVALPSKTEGSRTAIRLNDILLTITGGNVGNSAVVEREDIGEAYVSQHVSLIRLLRDDIVKHLSFVIRAENNEGGQIRTFVYGDKPGLSLTQIQSVIVALPPLAEQQRIVSKVQQLQQQLSQLEAQVQQSRQYAEQLLQSVLKEAFEQNGKVCEMEEEVLNIVAEGDA